MKYKIPCLLSPLQNFYKVFKIKINVDTEYLREAMQPIPIKNRSKINRRLGIKSSMRKPQSVFAALYLIWMGAGKPAKLEYCNMSSDDQNVLKIDDSLFDQVKTYWENVSDNVPTDFREKLENSELFTNQLEPLQVLLSLFWKVAQISFVNETLPSGAERTGGKRFLKKIEFTTHMDLVDFTLCDPIQDDINDQIFQALIIWLDGSEDDVSVLNNLKKHLTILSEDTWFKDGNTMFLQEGIYEALLTNDNSITFEGELKGPLRILNSAISNKLHTTLKKSTAGIIFEDPTDKEYIGRVKNLLDIEEINSDSLSDGSTVESNPESDTDFPRNLILYGAPGTGKSYKLNQRITQLNPHHFERITFYSDYSYSQFVGGYRPVPVYIQSDDNTKIKNKSNEDLNRPGQPTIEYTFVPGPLLRMYVEAKKNPQNTYLLIIEELNRADAAAVFGDFFQLLDRKSDGTSEYQIQLSKEAEEYIKDNNVDGDSISLPSNLFIWASLNSADQGVFPIDTAFKRRWEFEYLPLNENEAVVDGCTITLAIKDKSSDQRISISWNILRKKINQKLSDIGIQEDLMIGPFFLSAQEMRNDTAFKYKLLAYLRDDILRHQHHDFFSVKGTLDHLIKSYDNGENIFNFDLD